MEIDFINERTKFSWSPRDLDQFLGGSQEWIIKLSEALAKRGHSVSVFTDNEKEEEYNGVHFRNRRFFDRSSQVLVSFNAHTILHNPKERFNCEKFIVWSQYPVVPQWNEKGYERVDSLLVTTFYQKKFYEEQLTHKKLGRFAHKIQVHMPGVDESEFDWETPVKRNPNLAIYSSSWDRGLQSLIGCYPEFKRKFTKLELIVTYSPSFMSKLVGEWMPVPQEWKDLGIRFEEKDRKAMGRLYREASFLLYPCHGNEMFCLTSWKAQHAGCIAVNTNHMALKETTIRGVAVPLKDWASAAVTMMSSKAYQKEVLKRDMPIQSWDTSAMQFEQIISGAPIQA